MNDTTMSKLSAEIEVYKAEIEKLKNSRENSMKKIKSKHNDQVFKLGAAYDELKK